jgi:hypothetical protein
MNFSSDWSYAQSDPSQQLARLHYFSIMKPYPGGEVEMTITVKEFVTPADPAMIFFAQTDKQTNQSVAPYTPSGWGKTMLEALLECIKEVNRFPYQGELAAKRGEVTSV